MKIEYMLVKSKDDFCQTVEQFKNLLSANTRLVLTDETLETDHKMVNYSIELYEVEASKESIFAVSFISKYGNEEEQIEVLERADAILRRVNDRTKIFQINTVWDDVSMYYARKLYPAIVEVEALLRQIIYLFMLKNVGSKWLKEKSPEEVKKSIINTLEKNKLVDYPDTDALIYADFITLGMFFFEKYPLKSDYQRLIVKLREKENLAYSKLMELLDQYESKSNWDRYFSDAIEIENLYDKWKELYRFRNQVAHARKIHKNDYIVACKIIAELKTSFMKSLQHIKTISMTVEESEAVEVVAEQTIAPKRVVTSNGSKRKPLFDPRGYSSIAAEAMGNALLTLGAANEKIIDLDSAMFNISSGLKKFSDSLSLYDDPQIIGEISNLDEEYTQPTSSESKLD